MSPPAEAQAAAAPEIPAFSRGEIVSILAALILAMLLASLDQTIVATALSAISDDLHGWTLVSWVVSAYLIASTTTTPIYGRLGDLVGRRPVLLASIALFAASSVLCAMATTMPQLVAARFIQGIGGGGLRSVSLGVIADIIPPRERGRYQGYFSIVFATASIVGPVVGGLFVDFLSWHWIFLINVPLGLAAFWLVRRNLRGLPRPTRRPSIDWLGALLILASSTPILVAVGAVAETGSWASPRVWGLLAAGAVLIVALVMRERVAPEPMLPLRLFANRIFSVASVLSFLTFFLMIGLTIMLPLDYQIASGAAADVAGIRLIPMTAATVLGAFISGQLVTRTGRYRAFPIIGGFGMAAACALAAAFGLGRSVGFDTAVTALLGVSFGFQLPTVIVPVQNALALPDTGVGVACVMFFRLMGGALGVAVLSTVLIMALAAGAAAVPGHELLGPDPGLALMHLDRVAHRLPHDVMLRLHDVVVHGFSAVFWVATGVAVLTIAAAAMMKEIPLRAR